MPKKVARMIRSLQSRCCLAWRSRRVWSHAQAGEIGSTPEDSPQGDWCVSRPQTSISRRIAVLLIALVTSTFCGIWGAAGDEPPLPDVVRFNRDIRPILADYCFACHGPDANKREANLRFDVEAGVFGRDGQPVIRRGDPAASELMRRVKSQDPQERMPPPETGKELTARHIALLERWIAQGAAWEDHWAWIRPVKPAVPEVRRTEWVLNPIDAFVARVLEERSLSPAPEADRRTLIRRLYFDLLGMPPSAEEVDAFLRDARPQAYEELVDRLLASPQYGERMAVYWLDVVRYADTAGYHSDNHRDVYPYREYVIEAFNKNKPFDQFTIEQLAGDLLPGATREQRIASGYNRLLQTTEEGGAQAKEYTAKYAADRVRNTSVIWLGVTMGCCECHDHKYDPFTMRDFYSMEAFFADIQEKAVGRQDQTPVPTPEQQMELNRLEQLLAAARSALVAPDEKRDTLQRQWESESLAKIQRAELAWNVVRPYQLAARHGTVLTVQEDVSVLSSGPNPAHEVYEVYAVAERDMVVTGVRLEALTDESFPNKSLSRANGNFVLTEIDCAVGEGTQEDKGPWRSLAWKKAIADYEQPGFPVTHAIDGKANTGWAVDGHTKAETRRAVFVLKEPLRMSAGTAFRVRLYHESPYEGHNIGRFRLAVTSEPDPSLDGMGNLPAAVLAALTRPAAERSEEDNRTLRDYYRSIAPEWADERAHVQALNQKVADFKATLPQTLVSISGPPRVVRILPRGNWLDDSGEVVQPDVPARLHSLNVAGNVAGQRPTRLDFARWLVAPENPLTARVFVNRLWALCFGYGLVRTPEDFGTQGEWPTHPELLDWLAVEFVESGWDIKHLHKLILMSRTYRQSSEVDAATVAADPQNRLLARQNRFRVDAEFVRDTALRIAGILSLRMGGPSVKPYQPAGYWANLNFPKREWENDRGENLYRRGLYTYWCRTFLHPALLALDAPSREECTAMRPRSNTPLQALVLLNDPQFVEAARAFAVRILREGGADWQTRIRFAFQCALQRDPRPAELSALRELYEKHRAEYASDPEAAAQLLRTGEMPVPKDLALEDVAAWTSVARVLLNLHETITRY